MYLDLPVEVFIDHVLPNCDIRDIPSLALSNKFFAALCDDETYWKRRIQQDYNFSGAGTARTSGWKFIYRGLFDPRVYVWGDKSQGRLGLEQFPPSAISTGVPFPVQLKTNAKIVSIMAGGMSFHALDSQGNLHVIGTLDGTSGALRHAGFDTAGKKAVVPHSLHFPAPSSSPKLMFRSLSCGRLHAISLDTNGDVWTFLNWGRPFRMPALSEYLDQHNTWVAQLESGWTFSTVLTRNGEVLIWWPFGSPMSLKFQEKMKQMTKDGVKSLEVEGAIQCNPWDFEGNDFAVLPDLPALPALPSINDNEETRLVQIAGLDNQIIGLTNKGHVVKFASLEDDTAMRGGRWEYLPKFSNVEEVRSHPTFSQEEGSPGIDLPATMKITHITGHFNNFTAYSTKDSSIVLSGNVDTTSDTLPQALPELQNKDVISVVIGDYHQGALTANGKLLTWGGYSHGALGLGDPVDISVGDAGGFGTEQDREQATMGRRANTPPPVERPTEVRFDHARKNRKDRFCFAATAAGWHMGALVIDLEPDSPEELEEEQEQTEEPSHDAGQNLPPYTTPPFLPRQMRGPARGAFRVGFAGRGMGGGRGYTLPVMPRNPPGPES